MNNNKHEIVINNRTYNRIQWLYYHSNDIRLDNLFNVICNCNDTKIIIEYSDDDLLKWKYGDYMTLNDLLRSINVENVNVYQFYNMNNDTVLVPRDEYFLSLGNTVIETSICDNKLNIYILIIKYIQYMK